MAGLLRCDLCSEIRDSDQVKREPQFLDLWPLQMLRLKIEILKNPEAGTEIPDVCDHCMTDIVSKIYEAFHGKEKEKEG